MYVSINQWDFVNRGSKACFFGATAYNFHCRRPITGQYVTLTLEEDLIANLYALTDLKVFGFRKYLKRNRLNVRNKPSEII